MNFIDGLILYTRMIIIRTFREIRNPLLIVISAKLLDKNYVGTFLFTNRCYLMTWLRYEHKTVWLIWHKRN